MIVLAGAGHCHVEVLRQGNQLTSRGHSVTCISPESMHPYSGMSPGVLGGLYSRAEVELHAEELADRSGIHFICDRVTGLNADKRELLLESGRVQKYDVLSFNIGSESILEQQPSAEERPLEQVKGPGRIFRSKPVQELFMARELIEERARQGLTCNVAVVGGGPAGVELSGNAVCLLRDIGAAGQVSLYSSASDCLAGLRGAGYRYLHKKLRHAGVRILESVRVNPGDLTEDIILLAAGIRPNRILENLGLALADDHSLLVDAFLQVQGSCGVFAAGDCAGFLRKDGSLLERVGVYAVRQQEILLHNLAACAEGRPLMEFTASGPYLAGVNAGCGVGLLHKNSWQLKGRPAFILKDWIDRRFMKKYQ
ncbi:NAD(P)/FAD-dependent oxidoreductase [Spirochaeta dissipatitropha]